MAKRYIIDAIQATHWSVRLRDPESGEFLEVPLEPGAPWPGKIRSDAITPDGDEAPRADERAWTSAQEAPAAPPSAAKKPRKQKSERKGATRVTEPAALKEVMSSAALRSTPLDEDTVSVEDAATFTKLQTMLRRGRGRRAGKRGELGWDETTDAGRSGLIARFNDGAFKILHAGGDIYALFFEWDDGRYDRLACGTAEELMNLANERAEGEPPRRRRAISASSSRAACAAHRNSRRPRPSASSPSTRRFGKSRDLPHRRPRSPRPGMCQPRMKRWTCGSLSRSSAHSRISTRARRPRKWKRSNKHGQP